MRVLFVAPPRIGLYVGGLEIQIEKTAQELSNLGIDVVRYDPWRNQLTEVDLVHAFTFDSSLLPFAELAKRSTRPFVLSPVSNLIAAPVIFNRLRVRMSRFIPGFCSDIKRAQQLCDLSTHVVAQTEREYSLFVDVFGVPTNKVSVINNGTDGIFAYGDPVLFETKYGVRHFVLMVGSIDPNKNQLMIIRALNGTNIPLVIIGSPPLGADAYYKECVAAAGPNILFVGQLKREDPLLASAYSAATLFVMPSFRETWGLAIYEAAQAGCSLVISDKIPTNPILSSHLKRISPGQRNKWRQVIMEHYRVPNSKRRPTLAPGRLPSWCDIATNLSLIYEDSIQT